MLASLEFALRLVVPLGRVRQSSGLYPDFNLTMQDLLRLRGRFPLLRSCVYRGSFLWISVYVSVVSCY